MTTLRLNGAAAAAVLLTSACMSASHAVKPVPQPSSTASPQAQAVATVVLTKGAGISAAGCPKDCFHLHVSVTGVASGRYAYKCNSRRGTFYSGELDVKGPASDFDAPCYLQSGFEMPASFQLLNVPYSGTTQTLRSANATW